MLVLGLNSAHDSGVALVDDGKVLGLIQRERLTRIKRNALLTADFLDECLRCFGVAWADLDAVAMCTSQAWPIMLVDRTEFAVALDPDARLPARPGLGDASAVRRALDSIQQRDAVFGEAVSVERFRRYFGPDRANREYFAERPEDFLREPGDLVAPLEWPDFLSDWLRPDAADRLRRGLGHMHKVRLANYLPARFTLRGVSRPGLLLPHHMAHAAGAFYQSDFDSAVVHTLDNGDVFTRHRGYAGGMLMLGAGNRLHPVAPNFCYHGHLYQRVSEALALGHGGGAGKLMGLAPYGEPRYFDHTMVGDAFKVFGESYANGAKGNVGRVLDVLRDVHARLAGLGLERFDEASPHYREGWQGAADVRRPGIDFAASAQAVFEHCTGWFLSIALRAVYEHDPSRALPLCLGGGGALNCPANSTVWRTQPISDIFVPPACDDSGLPIGAALAVYHDYLDRPRVDQGAKTCASAYLGRAFDDARIRRAMEQAPPGLAAEEPGDMAAHAAAAIASGQIVAWYEGRSEIGPRALGHRSILADARGAETWARVNRLKKREYWRPFAPAVLVEDHDAWFRGAPPVSPHMLFTAAVRSSALPAITHVDGSARVQTVDATCGGFRDVVSHFKRITGVPVVLNTSLNGPGEPIVDTPEDALRFVAGSEIDALYIGGLRVTRRSGS